MAPNAAEQAYDALPESMRAWVSALADEAGPKSRDVRDQIVEELRRWRRDPIKDRKARRELARQMVEGPAGPARTAWTAAETALGLVAAALARKAIARFLTNEPAAKRPTRAAPRADVPGGEKQNPVAGPASNDYAGWSSRS